MRARRQLGAVTGGAAREQGAEDRAADRPDYELMREVSERLILAGLRASEELEEARREIAAQRRRVEALERRCEELVRANGRGAPPGPALPAGRPARVLVIDDSGLTLVALSRRLRQWGHEVATAPSGPEGVEIARRFQPEVVLCDIAVPGLDGYAVAAELRRDPRLAGVRLIAISGYGSGDEPRRCRAAGFERCLAKPLDPEELRRVLAEASVGAAPPSGRGAGRTGGGEVE